VRKTQRHEVEREGKERRGEERKGNVLLFYCFIFSPLESNVFMKK